MKKKNRFSLRLITKLPKTEYKRIAEIRGGQNNGKEGQIHGNLRAVMND